MVWKKCKDKWRSMYSFGYALKKFYFTVSLRSPLVCGANYVCGSFSTPFYDIFGVCLHAYFSNNSQFSREHIFVCFNKFPILMCWWLVRNGRIGYVPAKRMHRYGRSFCWMVAYCTGSNPIEIGDLWLKVKVTVTQYLFCDYVFVHLSLSLSLSLSPFLSQKKEYG